MRAVLTLGLALLVSGCANYFTQPVRPLPVVKIMATVPECGITEAGVRAVQVNNSDFSPALRAQLEETALIAGRDAVVVAMGPQPTPGYSLGMLDAGWLGDSTLNVNMMVEEPSPEMVQAQVVTHPCVILDVPAAGWNQLRVDADLPGFPVAWVRAD